MRGPWRGPAHRVAALAVLVALALVLSYVERLIPLPVPFPGVKLGLANLVVLVALYLGNWLDALAVSAVRVVLTGALFGSGFSIVYALAGALCSLGAMVAVRRWCGLSAVAVSAIGGLVHNLAQLGVASLAVGSEEVLYYAPILALSGIALGTLIGAVGTALIGRLRRALRCQWSGQKNER